MRILLFILLLLCTLSGYGQRLPNQFPEKTTAVGTDELYTQASGTAYRIVLDTVRMFMIPNIDQVVLGYEIDSTGLNVVDSLRGRFVIDASGDWWYVDKDKTAVLVGGTATEADELSAVDSIQYVPDTTGLTPKLGDIFVNSTKDTMGVYRGSAGWLFFYGGAGGGGINNVVEDLTPELGGTLDALGNSLDNVGDITFQNGASGGTIRTGTSNADKFLIQVYDVDGGAYTTVMEGDAGNDPQMQLIVDYFHFEDAADITKRVDFDASGVTTGTTRTLAFPDADGTIALTSDITGGGHIIADNGTGVTDRDTLNFVGFSVTDDGTKTIVTDSSSIRDTTYWLGTGQSNMLGYNFGANSSTYVGDTMSNVRVQAWDGSAWVTARIAENPFSTFQGPNNNMLFHFGRKRAEENPNETVRLLLDATVGRSIEGWTVDSSEYSSIRTIITNAGVTLLDGILWHQGESNSGAGTQGDDPWRCVQGDCYRDSLYNVIDGFVAETWFDTLQSVFIAGGLIRHTPVDTTTVRDSILQELNTDNRTYTGYASPVALPPVIYANVHFDSKALKEMGIRMYEVSKRLPAAVGNAAATGEFSIGGQGVIDEIPIFLDPGAVRSTPELLFTDENVLTIGTATATSFGGIAIENYADPVFTVVPSFDFKTVDNTPGDYNAMEYTITTTLDASDTSPIKLTASTIGTFTNSTGSRINGILRGRSMRTDFAGTGNFGAHQAYLLRTRYTGSGDMTGVGNIVSQLDVSSTGSIGATGATNLDVTGTTNASASIGTWNQLRVKRPTNSSSSITTLRGLLIEAMYNGDVETTRGFLVQGDTTLSEIDGWLKLDGSGGSATTITGRDSVDVFTDVTIGAGLTLSGGSLVSDQTAAEVNITDAGGYFTGTEVETALQEVGASLATTVTGTGTANRAAYWTGANTLSYSDNFLWENSSNWLTINGETSGQTAYINSAAPAGATGSQQERLLSLTSTLTGSSQVSSLIFGIGKGVAHPSGYAFMDAHQASTGTRQKIFEVYTGASTALNMLSDFSVSNAKSVISQNGSGSIINMVGINSNDFSIGSNTSAPYNTTFYSSNGTGYGNFSWFSRSATRMTLDSLGQLGIGTTTPAYVLDIGSKTGGARIPVGTTAQRPTGANGVIRYNTTDNAYEGYGNSTWKTLPSGTGTANRLAYWSGTSSISDDADLLYDPAAGTYGRIQLGAFTPGAAVQADDVIITRGNIRSRGFYLRSPELGDFTMGMFRNGNSDVDFSTSSTFRFYGAGGTNLLATLGNIGNAGSTKSSFLIDPSTTGNSATTGDKLAIYASYPAIANTVDFAGYYVGFHHKPTSTTIAGSTEHYAIWGETGEARFDGTGYLRIHRGTTAQRPSGAAGMIRYNSSNSSFEGYGSIWRNFIAGQIGSASGTTDASGDFTVTHNLGTTPVQVLITNTDATTPRFLNVIAKGATTFTVRVFDSGGTAVNAGAYSIDWIAK